MLTIISKYIIHKINKNIFKIKNKNFHKNYKKTKPSPRNFLILKYA